MGNVVSGEQGKKKEDSSLFRLDFFYKTGFLYYEKGHYQTSLQYFRKVVTLQTQLAALFSMNSVLAHHYIGYIEEVSGNLKEANAFYAIAEANFSDPKSLPGELNTFWQHHCVPDAEIEIPQDVALAAFYDEPLLLGYRQRLERIRGTKQGQPAAAIKHYMGMSQGRPHYIPVDIDLLEIAKYHPLHQEIIGQRIYQKLQQTLQQGKAIFLIALLQTCPQAISFLSQTFPQIHQDLLNVVLTGDLGDVRLFSIIGILLDLGLEAHVVQIPHPSMGAAMQGLQTNYKRAKNKAAIYATLFHRGATLPPAMGAAKKLDEATRSQAHEDVWFETLTHNIALKKINNFKRTEIATCLKPLFAFSEIKIVLLFGQLAVLGLHHFGKIGLRLNLTWNSPELKDYLDVVGKEVIQFGLFRYHPMGQSESIDVIKWPLKTLENLCATFIHELTHALVLDMYDNHCKPYFLDDGVGQQHFSEITNRIKKEVRLNTCPKFCDPIQEVFAYPSEEHEAELIVRVPQIIAQSGKAGLDALETHYPDLLAYYHFIFMPAAQRHMDYLRISHGLDRISKASQGATVIPPSPSIQVSAAAGGP